MKSKDISKHLIDAELLRACNGEPPVLSVGPANLEEMRAFLAQLSTNFVDESCHDVTVSKVMIPGPEKNQQLALFVYGADGSSKPGLLHLHGGGFVLGTAAMDERYCKKMAKDLGCVVVSVDYRLAPETKFPGAIEDAYSALLWMKQASLGIDTSRLAITGESAGAGLAASLSFLIRDRRELSIVLQFLTYPMLDDRTASTRDPGLVFGEFGWTRESNRFGWSSYLGIQPGAESVPYPASPARVEDLTGLPPTYIACGALDLFAAENLDFAQRLLAQGVPTEIHIYPGAIHGFPGALGTKLANTFFAERRRVFSSAFAKES